MGKGYSQQKVTSRSASMTYFHWRAKAHAPGLLTPVPNKPVLPKVYSRLPRRGRPCFMAAITFFLVVNNQSVRVSQITVPHQCVHIQLGSYSTVGLSS